MLKIGQRMSKLYTNMEWHVSDSQCSNLTFDLVLTAFCTLPVLSVHMQYLLVMRNTARS